MARSEILETRKGNRANLQKSCHRRQTKKEVSGGGEGTIQIGGGEVQMSGTNLQALRDMKEKIIWREGVFVPRDLPVFQIGMGERH